MPDFPELIRDANAAKASGDQDRVDSSIGALQLHLKHELPKDPLVAASCLALATQPDLISELEKIAAGLQSRQGLATALVVSPDGRGSVLEIVVDLAPGSSGVWCPHDLGRDAQLAAQIAAAVALGGDLERWGVRWQVRGPALASASRVRGSSLGLAMAMAIRAALGQRAIPDGWAFTGGVDLDGQIVEVAGVPAKLRAAAESGIQQVGLSINDKAGLRIPDGLSAHGYAHFEAVCQEIWPAVLPERRGRPSLKWAWLVLPLVLSWTALLDGFEIYVQGPLMRQVLGELPADNVMVLNVPTKEIEERRWDYPDKIDALVAAGVTTIGFDVLFLDDHAADTEFSESIRRADSAGVKVILPRRFEDEHFLPLATELVDVGQSAHVLLNQEMLFGTVRGLHVQRRAVARAEWALSVELLAAHLGAARPQLHGDTLQVKVTRNRLHREQMMLPPVARPKRLDWDAPEGFVSAKDKAVLVGVVDGYADVLRTPSGNRYGVEIHAAAVETLARQRGLRRASPLTELLLVFVLGLTTTLGARRLGARRRYWAYGLGLGCIGALLIALKAGLVFAFSPVVLASVIGVELSRRV